MDDALTFYVAPHYDMSSVTAESCQTGCAQLGPEYVLAGITQGNICLCGSNPSRKLTWIPCKDSREGSSQLYAYFDCS